MRKASSRTLQITRRIAAVSVRPLMGEFQMLMSAFPLFNPGHRGSWHCRTLWLDA